ncbi:MAG: molybdopterin molybdotransferase MoeA [Pseudomonadota bacterium]
MKQNITYKEVLNECIDAAQPGNPISIPVSEAAGLVTSAEIKTLRDVPGFDNSAMDGWAINTHDIKSDAPIERQAFRVSDESFAGQNYNGEIPPGCCVKIMTGARIPPNCNAVIPVENSKGDGNIVNFDFMPKTWANIRKFDNDTKKGDALIPKNKRLQPADIANLYTQGITHLSVYPKPQVVFFTTGDEIVDENPRGDAIINSNRVFLDLKFREWGIDVKYMGNAGDTKEKLKETIQKAELLGNGLIISTGGVSMGERDYIRPCLEELGWKIIFWRAKIKPGRPLLLAKKNNQVFLGLPGNPVSVAVLCEVVVKGVVDRLSGMNTADCYPKFYEGILTSDLKYKSDRTSFLMGRYKLEDDRYNLEIFDNQSSQSLSLLSRGNALVFYPEKRDGFKSGDQVQFLVM